MQRAIPILDLQIRLPSNPIASNNHKYVELAEAEVTFGVTKSVHVTFPWLASTFCKPLRAAESKFPGSLFSRRCCIIVCSKALLLQDHVTTIIYLRSLHYATPPGTSSHIRASSWALLTALRTLLTSRYCDGENGARRQVEAVLGSLTFFVDW